jgi:hypothetical protein
LILFPNFILDGSILKLQDEVKMNARRILKFHKNFAAICEIRSAEFPSIYQNAVKFQLEILSQGTLRA